MENRVPAEAAMTAARSTPPGEGSSPLPRFSLGSKSKKH